MAGAAKLAEFELNMLEPEFLSDDRKLLLSIFKHLREYNNNCDYNSTPYINPNDIFFGDYSVETYDELNEDNFESGYINIPEHLNDSVESNERDDHAQLDLGKSMILIFYLKLNYLFIFSYIDARNGQIEQIDKYAGILIVAPIPQRQNKRVLKVKTHFVLSARSEIERKLKMNQDKAAEEKAKQNRLHLRNLKKQQKVDAAAARMKKKAEVVASKMKKKPPTKKGRKDVEVVAAGLKKQPTINQKRTLRKNIQVVETLEKEPPTKEVEVVAA